MNHPRFRVNYSAKANTNLELLKIICQEGLDVDAMSPGEMYLEMQAGFTPDRIMFIGNNVSVEEMKYAVDRGIRVSVDSLAQLAMLGEINRGGEVCVRVNPGIGAGHHEKVITGGKKAKFGISLEDLPNAIAMAESFDMSITGLNQHIGSCFLESEDYLKACSVLLQVAESVPTVRMVDFGGGFGVPYQQSESRLDLISLRRGLETLVKDWESKNRPLTLRVEPGRYVVAECGVLLGTVHSVKENYGTHFVGTDVGFNVLARPVMYDSYHEVDVSPISEREYSEYTGPVYLTGNICESGDTLAHDRVLPHMEVGDVIIIHDAGAYGFVMASNYNSRPLPAEVLIQEDGSLRLIRRRQSLEDLWPGF
jgi:diaminopimelate decarboxylase